MKDVRIRNCKLIASVYKYGVAPGERRRDMEIMMKERPFKRGCQVMIERKVNLPPCSLSKEVKLSFILLTWNSQKYVKRCLDSIVNKCDHEGVSFEVIVIDNGSEDGTAAILNEFKQKRADSFKLIFLNSNKGTTHSRNIGFKKARGKYICVLDSDTEFGEGEFSSIFKLWDYLPNLGIVAPRLVLGSGAVQNSVKKFPAFWHKIIKLPKAVFGLKVKDCDFYESFPFTNIREVDSAISACWFFSRDLIDHVGLLDEKIFYSPEDLDYSLRVRKSGRKIIYFPHMTLLHHTQQISHKSPFSKVSLSHLSGLLYYYRKHGCWFSPRFQ